MSLNVVLPYRNESSTEGFEPMKEFVILTAITTSLTLGFTDVFSDMVVDHVKMIFNIDTRPSVEAKFIDLRDMY